MSTLYENLTIVLDLFTALNKTAAANPYCRTAIPKYTAYQIVVGGEMVPGAADREIQIYVRFSLVARPTILVREDCIRAMP